MHAWADFSYENQFWTQNYTVIGIDEVGRGCLAGPVHVGAVSFSPLSPKEQKLLLKLKIHDSKKVSKKNRDKLFPLIQQHCQAHCVASGSVEEINKLGIVGAIGKAALLAVSQVVAQLPADRPIIVLTDTLRFPTLAALKLIKQEPVPQGDGKSVTIAAASIIAKVTRDAEMDILHNQFPVYNWLTNKGYATKDHKNGLKEHGACPLHRTLFIRKTFGIEL